MAGRTLHALVIPLCLAFAPLLGGCGGEEEPSAATVQREQLVRSAKRALKRYNPRTVPAGAYRGRGVRLRISERGRVDFSIRTRCRRRALRAFPERPPRLRRGGRFAYRERGRRYRLGVSGRVRARTARGALALRTLPARGRGCRALVSWRAVRR
jgi:hypothetical protein